MTDNPNMPRSTPFAATRSKLLADPETAKLYLEEAKASGNEQEYKEALRHIEPAQKEKGAT